MKVGLGKEEGSPSTPGTRAPILRVLVLAALTVVTTVRLVSLARIYPLTYDEGWHVFVAQQPSWGNFWLELLATPHPPLFFLFLKGAIATAGPSIMAYRAVSLISIVAATLLCVRILGQLGASFWWSVAGAAAFGLSMSSGQVGIEVRSYPLATAFLVASFSLYLDWLTATQPALRPHKQWLYAGLMTAAIFAHYSSLIILAAMIILPIVMPLWSSSQRRRLSAQWRHGVRGVALMFGIPLVAGNCLAIAQVWESPVPSYGHVSAFLYDSAAETMPSFLGRTLGELAVHLTPFVYQAGPMAAAAGGFLALLATGLAFRAGRDSHKLIVLSFLTIAIVFNAVLALVGIYPFGGLLRHEFFLFPFAVICFFAALTGAGTSRLPRALGVGLSALVVGGGILVSSVTAHRLLTSVQVAATENSLVRALPSPLPNATGYADRFHFLAIFGDLHDREWALAHQSPGLQVWRVNGREPLSVCRGSEFFQELQQPSAYENLKRCLDVTAAERVVLLLSSHPLVRRLGTTDVDAIERLAESVGLHLETLAFDTEPPYVLFSRTRQ